MVRAKSHVMSSMTGSIAGLTGQRTQNGNIILGSKSKPNKSRSSQQNYSRIAFSVASGLWSAGPDDLKLEWDFAGKAYSMTGRRLWLSCMKTYIYFRNSHPSVHLLPIKSLPSPRIPLLPPVDVKFKNVLGPPNVRITFNCSNNSPWSVAIFGDASIPYRTSKNFFDGWFNGQKWGVTRVNSGVQDAGMLIQNLQPHSKYFCRISVLYRNASPALVHSFIIPVVIP